MTAENQVLSLISKIGGNTWLFGETEETSLLMKFIPVQEAIAAKIVEIRQDDGHEYWTLKDEISDEIFRLTDGIFKNERFSVTIGDISSDVSGFNATSGDQMIITMVPVSAEEAVAFQKMFHEYGAKVEGIPEQGKEL